VTLYLLRLFFTVLFRFYLSFQVQRQRSFTPSTAMASSKQQV